MKNKLLFFLTFLLVTINAKAQQTILAAGDLSIIGFNGIINSFSSGPLFVCWVDLAPNTVIKFTNNAFNSVNDTATGQYRVGHATVTWTSPSTTLAAGTVVSIIGDGSTTLTTNYGTVSAVTATGATTFGLNLASTGGNIFAFQGTGATTGQSSTGNFSGTLLYGIQYAGLNSVNWLTSGLASSIASWLPTVIVSHSMYFGSNALAATYNGARSGLTIAQYKTAVNNASNWTTAVSPNGVTLSTTPFTTTPLAVSLSSFTAKKENNIAGLYWTTLSELDNIGFGIERSGDGKAFQSIGSVDSKAKNGNSNTQLNYSFSDMTPLTGMNYYRLVEQSKEGVNVYSDIRTVSFDNLSVFNAYPNPAKNQITIEHMADNNESLKVRFTDVLGKVVLEATVQTQKGFNQNQIDMNSLVHGIYNMTITNNSGLVYNTRIVKN